MKVKKSSNFSRVINIEPLLGDLLSDFLSNCKKTAAQHNAVVFTKFNNIDLIVHKNSNLEIVEAYYSNVFSIRN